ncbi:Thioesterase family protein [Lasiodiplodia theobromae]|uniref:Thioesterase family protein n=1 Tax=Lasiodiplodia theobromae TaxID=45133 RepID=UPI0015C40184|nr:Thioesterase family protein [Lasiodiplodia theobromae]KAF4534410.1 Thioesterase family protein [Lasiodiplodia theobromae]
MPIRNNLSSASSATRALRSALPRTALTRPVPIQNLARAPVNYSQPHILRTLQHVRLQTTVAEPTPTPQPNDQTPPPPRAPRSRPIRILRAVLLAAFSFTLGATMSAAPALSVADDLLSPPSDAETLQLWQPAPGTRAAEIEAQLQSHPGVAALRADESLVESRPHMRIPNALRHNNLTAGTLLGDEELVVPALAFSAPDGSRMISVHYVGPALCGHPGVVHGGLLATLLDEGLARCCFPALPNKIGMTASLTINYKAPCKAGQFIVLRAETTKVEGRKAWVKGRLETLVDEEAGEKPLVLDEAEALFIEPRQAASMAKLYNPNP